MTENEMPISVSGLVGKSGEALYRAKRGGRNRVELANGELILT
jgi:PleD family two-component response regulator